MGTAFDRSYEQICRYRCPSCGGRGNVQILKGHPARTLVYHYPGCRIRNTMIVHWPGLFRGMRRDEQLASAA